MSKTELAHNDNTVRNLIKLSDNRQENILPELKEQENWLCWTYKTRDGKQTKIPLNPHNGSFASSSDPDTWSDYETAKEHSQNNPEAEGLGFVFSEQDLYAGVDLDNARDPETAEVEPWAAEVIERLDSYTEVSPSGTGVHILVQGYLPEDARTRENQESTLEAFEESEMEVYDSGRFFTMTFDHVQEAPTVVEQRSLELRELHEDFVAREEDTEDDTETGAEPNESQLDLSDQELIEKAKNAQNGREFERLWNGDISAYDNDHSRADMALLQRLAFWTGKDANRMERLFDQSGLTREKWNSRDDYRERSIKNAISNCSEVYEPPSSNGDSDSETEARTTVWTPLFKKEGRYCVRKNQKNGEVKTVQLTTYTIEKNAVLVDPVSGDKKWDLTVHPQSTIEEPYDIVVEPSIFNELRKFKDEIQIGETTTYDGGKKDLNHLRQVVAHQEAPHRIATTSIGLHDGELVTPSGVFTSEDEDPEYRYVETGSAMDSKWELDELEDYDEEAVQQILELLPQTRDSERFIPILGWMFASAFTPQIREWEGEVPMMGVDADTGAGKTSIIGYLVRMLGLDGTPMSAQDTKFSLLKNLASTTSIPVWLDEYKPSDMAQYKLDQTQDLLRKVTRGGHETRGNADKTQEVYELEAPVILSGEQAIQGAAEQRRMIRTQLKKSSTESGSTTAQAWAQLDGGSYETKSGVEYCTGYDPIHHAKAFHRMVLESSEDELEESWNKATEHIYELLSEHDIAGINGIELVALTMVKWGMAVYSKFSYQMDVDMDEIPSSEEIDDALLYIANQMGETNRVSHVEEFLALVSDAARSRQLVRGKDYEVIHQGKEGEQLLLKLRPTHQTVTKFVHNNGLTGYDLLNNPNDYRSRLKDHEGQYVLDMSKYNQDINRCIAFDMETLETQIDDFESSAFYHEY